MRNFLLVSALCFTILSCQNPRANSENISNTSSFDIKRGTNIAHWLSQSRRTGKEREEFFTQKDIAFIDSAGFDHIRLPVDEVQLYDSLGNRIPEAFELLDKCLGWCRDAGLKVILDLHILRSHYFNAEVKPLWTDPAEQDKFIQIWKDLSSAVKKYPEHMLAYEFMNEPVADDPEQWNTLLARVTDSIRSWEPGRYLVIGSNRFQSAGTFDQLRIPAGDKKIILSFHFYEPFHLTHYRASWTKLKDFSGTVAYPGQIVVNGQTPEEKRMYTIDTLTYMMRKPIHLADSLGLPLYCGEFGVIDGSPEESKLAWYRDMVAIFEKNNIAYANWNFKAGSFGIVDKDLRPDSAYVHILTGKDGK